MNHDTRHLLDPAPLRRIFYVAALVMVLIGGIEAVRMLGETATPQPASTQAPAAAQHPNQTDLTDNVQEHLADPPPISLFDEAIGFIEPFEGRRTRVYRDSRGRRTIGVGFNLDRPGAADDLSQLLPGVGYRALLRGEIRLTDSQIDVLLQHDVRRALDTARRQVKGFEHLAREAQLVIIDMTFNTGSLHKWRNLRGALARNDYAAAADAMHDSRWRRQTGQRAARLIELMQSLAQG